MPHFDSEGKRAMSKSVLLDYVEQQIGIYGFVPIASQFFNLGLPANPKVAEMIARAGIAGELYEKEPEALARDFNVFGEADDRKASGKRTVSGIASVREVSRSNLLIEPEGIDLRHFRRNPVALACHHQIVPMTLEPAVVALVGRVGIMDKALAFKNMNFDTDPLAEAWLQKIRSGFVRMVSVGVRPVKVEYVEEERGKGENRELVRYLRFIESELIEISPCGIGANRGAFIDAGEREQKPQSFKALADALHRLESEVESLRSIIRGDAGLDGDGAADEAYGDASFPDAAFIVEKGAPKEGGKTVQKYRHLPHHNRSAKSATDNGSVDLPHLRNALARVNQVKPHLESRESYISRAKSHLNAHARVLLDSRKKEAEELQEALDSMNVDPERIGKLTSAASRFACA